MNKWKQSKIQAVLLIMLSVLATACTTTPKLIQIRSDIDALTTSDVSNKHHFVILPANKDIKEQDLQFKEFKAYLEKALGKRGFVKADTLQDGDVVLFLNYGVSEPQTYQYAYNVPAWYGFGGTYPYYRWGWYYPMSPYYTQRIETYLMYRRYLSLEAYDMTAYVQNKTPVQLWKISVQSQGLSNDLRLIFPYMVTAMQPYIGSNTGHMVTVDVDQSDPLFQDILLSNPYRVTPIAPQKEKSSSNP
ncbi:DUF4136 domain-containing protein [Methylomonas sp. MgM2]